MATLLALVLCLGSVLFVACNDGGQSKIDELQQQINGLQDKLTGYEANDLEKNIKIYIGDDDPISVTTKENKVFYVLSDLVESSSISAFAFQGGSYGAYITKLNDLYDSYDADTRTSHYISVYHSIDDVNLKGMGEIEHNGVTFFYSNVGVSSLPIVDGASYYFAQETYQYPED